MAGPQPRGEDRVPAFIVGARCQFSHVIAWTVGFDAGEFAEIIHRVTAIGRAAADTEQEQPSAALAQRRETYGDPFNDIAVDLRRNLRRLL